MRITTQTGPDFRLEAANADNLQQVLLQSRSDLQACRALIQEGTPAEHADVGRALKRLTQALVLSHEWEEALLTGTEARDIWHNLGRDKATFLANLQLAELHARTNPEPEALDAYLDLIRQTESGALVIYRDFVLESWGRELAARKHWADAQAKLRACLGLRRARGNAKQIQETETLLLAIQAASTAAD